MVKALTLWQPWAALVEHGHKTIETRSWATSYRGPLIVHAASKGPKDGYKVGGWRVDYPNHPGFLVRVGHSEVGTLHLGAIVATAELTGCVPINRHPARPMQPNVYTIGDTLTLRRNADQVWPEDINDQRPFGDFTPGRWAWLLEDIKPTTERCPACWGTGNAAQVAFTVGPGWNAESGADRCLPCSGLGSREPIPAKGRQRLWDWTPGGEPQ